MKSDLRPVIRLLAAALLIAGCSNHIIQRAADDFLPLEPGNWWLYSNASSYEPQTVYREVEPAETLLNVECFPVTTSGIPAYYAIVDAGIREYIKIVYAFAGAEYTVLEGFVLRLETPLVEGNRFADSLVDSISVAGAWIKARYVVNGLVSDYESHDIYGSVYPVHLSIQETVITPDSTLVLDRSITELYAPDIGLVQFENEQSTFHLSDYFVQ